jgi:hypothetical protein
METPSSEAPFTIQRVDEEAARLHNATPEARQMSKVSANMKLQSRSTNNFFWLHQQPNSEGSSTASATPNRISDVEKSRLEMRDAVEDLAYTCGALAVSNNPATRMSWGRTVRASNVYISAGSASDRDDITEFIAAYVSELQMHNAQQQPPNTVGATRETTATNEETTHPTTATTTAAGGSAMQAQAPIFLTNSTSQ